MQRTQLCSGTNQWSTECRARIVGVCWLSLKLQLMWRRELIPESLYYAFNRRSPHEGGAIWNCYFENSHLRRFISFGIIIITTTLVLFKWYMRWLRNGYMALLRGERKIISRSGEKKVRRRLGFLPRSFSPPVIRPYFYTIHFLTVGRRFN